MFGPSPALRRSHQDRDVQDVAVANGNQGMITATDGDRHPT